MSLLEFVDVSTARAARGVRLVVPGIVPSPWSEAAKGLFQIQQVQALAVRQGPRPDPEITAWVPHHNVPIVLYGDEPPRTIWSEIVALADRLGEPGALVPTTVERRAHAFGMIHEIAGEDGLGWNARLLMIDAGLRTNGARGFPTPIARYLAPKYGHAEGQADRARARLRAILVALREALGDREFFADNRPGALDVYAATFLTAVSPLTEADCPKMLPALRHAFAAAAEEIGPEVSQELAAHRMRMLERHLGWPIAL